MMTRLSHLIVATLLLVFLTACGVAKGVTGQNAEGESMVTTTRVIALPSAQQNEILADGTVTHSEMKRAVDSAIQCIESQGHHVQYDAFSSAAEGWRGYDNGIRSVSGTTEAEIQAAVAALDRCMERHMVSAQDTYSREYGPSFEDSVARDEEIVSCMQERGIDPTDIADAIGDFTWDRTYTRCDAETPYPDELG